MKNNILEVDFSELIKKKNQTIADSDGDSDSEGPSDVDDASKDMGSSMPTFIVGDKVKNIKPDCTHCGSEGIVSCVQQSKADDDGDDDSFSAIKVKPDGEASITYITTNDGPNWKPGDSLVRGASYLKKC